MAGWAVPAECDVWPGNLTQGTVKSPSVKPVVLSSTMVTGHRAALTGDHDCLARRTRGDLHGDGRLVGRGSSTGERVDLQVGDLAA